jgi:hypothetical protein
MLSAGNSPPRRRGSAPAALLLGSMLALGPAGCGSASPSTADSTNNLPLFNFSNVDINGVFITDIKVTITGSLISIVDWTLPSDDVEIYVTDTTCNTTLARVVRQSCTLLGQTSTTTAKPKQLTMNISPGIYRVFVANFGPASAESGTLQISLKGH